MEYNVGDVVQIVSERTSNMNSLGEMDCWLGEHMTIDRIMGIIGVTGGIRMKEDDNKWNWLDTDIEKLVSSGEVVKDLGKENVSVGDKFIVVKSKTENMNETMKELCNCIVTISDVRRTDAFRIKEDNERWIWERGDFAEKI